jgi:biopolymer transport protein ExbD
MPHVLTCPRCARKWTVLESQGLRESLCPRCGMRMPVPADEPPQEEPHPAAAAALLMTPKKKTEFHDLIDMTAMVDIVFFLLIFFLVTSMQTNQASIEIPAPDPQQSTAKATPTIEQFEKDGDFVIVKVDQDDTIWVDDQAVPSQQELIVRLRDMREGGGGDSRGILVLGHEDASHATVVMVLDAGAEAGMQDIRLALDNLEQ